VTRPVVLLISVVAAGATLAVAATSDPRGWTAGGTVAAGTAAAVAGPVDTPAIPFPPALVERIDRPTVLFYFSPTCPHCRHVAPEIEALHRRLVASRDARVLGIASPTGTAEELQEFTSTFGITFPVVVDEDRGILTAMGARATPSAMLVTRDKRPGTLVAKDRWYPYLAGQDVLIEGRVGGNLWSIFRPGATLGNQACAACHTEEHASFELSWHSVAWNTLVRQGKDRDRACTPCHVTGVGPAALPDVGCEACHGPGGPHDGERTDPRTTCARCHDADHSIAFSYEKGLPLIDHFAAVGRTDEEIRARRLELHAGEGPRPLLAFPTGKTVGSIACQRCHPAAYDTWATSPHATAAGCEECHGPGEAHVAAKGGTENIQGLGESCPVCVLEALCTSCHTPVKSPDFELEDALAAIRHGD